MSKHNLVWTIVIIAGWAILVASAAFVSRGPHPPFEWSYRTEWVR